jgi:hypothetical protein
VTTPLAGTYRPELDQSTELNADRQNYFQGLIGVLCWICELGRLAQYPDAGLNAVTLLGGCKKKHLDQLFHIFAYSKQYDASTMVFDDTEPVFDARRFKEECNWSENYPGAKEVLPPDMPMPHGWSVVMPCFVDADHAGCRATRQLHTGVIIFVNRAPILWFLLKMQNKVARVLYFWIRICGNADCN